MVTSNIFKAIPCLTESSSPDFGTELKKTGLRGVIEETWKKPSITSRN